MRTALIDADIVAFQAAARHETWTDFGRTVGELSEAQADVDDMIDKMEKLDIILDLPKRKSTGSRIVDV